MPTLTFLVEGKGFLVYCDSLEVGLGDVFMHKNKVIAYASRQLKTHEMNYPTHDLMLVAVVFILMLWQNYLYGCYSEIFIDYHSLYYFFGQKDINLRQCRWIEFLKEYGILILYHLRKTNLVADVLTQKVMSIESLAFLETNKQAIALNIQSLSNQFI